jgi:hypothetical protein
MEALSESRLKALYQHYASEFQRRDSKNAIYRVLLDYENSTLVADPISYVEFCSWLVSAWRNHDLKLAWLSSFVRAIPERLQLLPSSLSNELTLIAPNLDDTDRLRRAA